MDKVHCMLLFGVLAVTALVQDTKAQTAHVVGDNIGWAIPNNGATAYINWAAGRTFRVGDILVFNFVTNQHDVLQVPKASFDGCTSQNAIGNPIMTGPANVTLDSAGDHYYICTFGRHCQNGQKLAITVSSTGTPGANPPTPSNPTTPAAAGPSRSNPGGSTPPPAPSSSTAMLASLVLSVSAITLAIFL